MGGRERVGCFENFLRDQYFIVRLKISLQLLIVKTKASPKALCQQLALMTRSVLEHFITCSALSWLEVISLFRSVRKLIKGLLFLWNLCKVSCKKFPKWFIDYYSNKLECFLPTPNNTFSFSIHLKTCALMRETARNIKGGKEVGLIAWFIEQDFTWKK